MGSSDRKSEARKEKNGSAEKVWGRFPGPLLFPIQGHADSLGAQEFLQQPPATGVILAPAGVCLTAACVPAKELQGAICPALLCGGRLALQCPTES